REWIWKQHSRSIPISAKPGSRPFRPIEGSSRNEPGPTQDRLILEFLRRGLADDYWLVVQPEVYGKGPQYWGPMKAQATLKLLSSTTMEDGDLLLHYETVRGFRA